MTVTGRDADARIPGYFDSPFPGEDGGPRRQMIGRGAALNARGAGAPSATWRAVAMANMVVLRAPGEVYLQGSSPPSAETTAWVERIDAHTVDAIVRSPDLPGGPWWPGGILVHENGDLYVTHGRWCHRLSPDLRVVAARELPCDRPYNSLLALSDGCLVMKSFVRDGSDRSYFSILEPDGLAFVESRVEIPEGSIARISKDITDGREHVYVAGDHTIFRFTYRERTLTLDEGWSYRYRTSPGQSFGWDPVIADGFAWFMDNGDAGFQRSLRGCGKAPDPLHLHRVSLTDASDHASFAPFDLPHGTIVNPPLIDASRRIAVAYDSGNGRIGAFRYDRGFERLWEREMGASNHFLLYPDTGEIVVNDFDGDVEHVAVLDIETGEELARARTGSPIASVVFQSPGWERDVYSCAFPGITRVAWTG